MPTVKPRTTVTLEPSTHAVIDRLAVLQGRSRGAVIADLLDSVAPAMTRTVALLEAAAAAPQQVKD
uniref:ribbon-helix-helix domain-containing protein n=1 Tax=Pseudomonas aeruginosa TaxID=287 RepID=UPI001C0B5BD0